MNDHRICFVGDSFIQGTCDPQFLGWVGRVSQVAQQKGHNLTTYNLGIRRDTSIQILGRWQQECTARLDEPLQISDSCAYVLFSFGANDMTKENGQLRVDFEQSVQNFATIYRTAKQRYPTLMIGPLPVGEKSHDARILALCAKYTKMAAQLSIPYLPLAAHFMDNMSWITDTASQDGTHPGASGYQMIADLILEWDQWWFK